MEVGRIPAASHPPPLSLSLSLPPSFLPSLAGGDSEPAYKLRLADDPAPSTFPSPLPSRRRKGTSPHSKVDRRSCSTSPSLPLSLLLSLPPSLPVPPFLPCRRRQRTSPQIKVRRKSRSLLLSLPPPSLLCRRRQRTRLHTKVERRSRAEETPWNGNEAVVLPKAPCLWRKLVGQPVCTQTCWPACMYTQQSTWVQVICSQGCRSSDTSNPCCEIPSRKCPDPQIMFYLALSRHNTHPANCCIIHNVHKYLFITV